MTPAGRLKVRARNATEAARGRLWPELVRRNPGYARYERRTNGTYPSWCSTRYKGDSDISSPGWERRLS